MKVLIIEDDIKIATALHKGLQLEGYTVDVAHDGQAGFDLASTEVYDCIVLDWMLPLLSGHDLCLQLRQQGLTVPVIFLTAKGQLEDKLSGLNGGADDYLTKPFAFDELLARIRALQRRPPQLQPDQLQLGQFYLDHRTKQAGVANRTISLTLKEYALLDYLLKHPGQVISKQEIIDRVWSFESDILPNTIEVYVATLRRKIASLGSAKVQISTVRGHGYKMITTS